MDEEVGSGLACANFLGSFFQLASSLGDGTDEAVDIAVHHDDRRLLGNLRANGDGMVVVAVHGMADGDEIAHAVLHTERSNNRLDEQIAAHQLVGAHAAPFGVHVERRLAADLGDAAIAVHLGDDAELVGLGIGTRELVHERCVGIEERNDATILERFGAGIQPPLTGNLVVSCRATEERDAADHVGDTLDVVLFLGGRCCHVPVIRRAILASRLHGRLCKVLADAARAFSGIAGSTCRANDYVIATESKDADERRIATDEALGRDDTGERRVAKNWNARQLGRDGIEQFLGIVIAAAVGHGDFCVSDACLNLAGDFFARLSSVGSD